MSTEINKGLLETINDLTMALPETSNEESYPKIHIGLNSSYMQMRQELASIGSTLLQGKGILHSIPPECSREDCGRAMSFVKKDHLVDGYIWQCPSHKDKKKSLRHGSLLANEQMELRQFVLLAYLWAQDARVDVQEAFTGLSCNTVIQWNQYLRGICSRWVLEHNWQLGGVGKVVEIDKLVFTRLNYNVGHVLAESWVFGVYDVERKIGFMREVPKRDRDTLLPIIEAIIAPGSIINSNKWAAYRGAISALPVIPPYEHRTVKRSEHFVDPETHTTTNQIDAFWSWAKEFKCIQGTSPNDLPSYLDEFMWKQMNGGGSLQTFEMLLQQIALYYNVA